MAWVMVRLGLGLGLDCAIYIRITYQLSTHILIISNKYVSKSYQYWCNILLICYQDFTHLAFYQTSTKIVHRCAGPRIMTMVWLCCSKVMLNLCQSCTNIVPMFCQCCANVMQILCKCCANVVPCAKIVLSCANIVPMLCKLCANVVPILCQMLHQCCINDQCCDNVVTMLCKCCAK